MDNKEETFSQESKTMSSIKQWLKPWSSTLCVENVPLDLREVGIISGYRLEHQPWSYYIKSIFKLHNETFNVWTHFLGALAVLYNLKYSFDDLNPRETKARELLVLFTICCLITNLTSSVVHLFHSKSHFIHYIGVLMDYIGVSVYPFGTAILQMYIGANRTVYYAIHDIFIYLNICLGLINFIGVALAKLYLSHPSMKVQRKLLQAGSGVIYFIFIAVLLVPRFFTCVLRPNCQMSTLGHVAGLGILLISMGAMYSFLFPERFWPGRFDLIGHSHQMFHVIATMAQIIQIKGVVVDVQIHGSDVAYDISEPNMAALYRSLYVLLFVDFCVLSVLIKKIVIPKTKYQ